MTRAGGGMYIEFIGPLYMAMLIRNGVCGCLSISVHYYSTIAR